MTALFEFVEILPLKISFSAFRFLNGVAGALAPVRSSRRRFILRFIEKENGGGTNKKR